MTKKQFCGCNIRNFAFKIFQWYDCCDDKKHGHGRCHNSKETEDYDEEPKSLTFEDEEIKITINNR